MRTQDSEGKVLQAQEKSRWLFSCPHLIASLSSRLDDDADTAQLIVERSRHGRKRQPSEQVESLRTSFAFAMSTRTPEPPLQSVSGTSQPVTAGSSHPGLPIRKRKRSSTNLPHGLEPHNASLEPESDVALEMPQPTRRGLSHPASSTQKRKRATGIFRKLEPRNKSPRSESDAGPETPQPITRDFSQPPVQKQNSKSRIIRELSETRLETSQPASVSPQRKSAMLLELEAHNESPEQDIELDMTTFYESTEGPFTRSGAHQVASFLKNKTPTPPKSLNVDKLMLADFSGRQKGTKTWYFPDGSGGGPSRQQKQSNSRQEADVNIEQEDEAGNLSKNTDISVRSHSQPRLTRRKTPQQSPESTGDGGSNQSVVPESPSSVWAHEKGQSSLNTALAVTLL